MKELIVGLSNNLMKEITPYIMVILVDLGNKILFADDIPDLEPFLYHRTEGVNILQQNRKLSRIKMTKNG